MLIDDLKTLKHESNEARKKSILKTITWRIIASTDTLFVAWLLTGNFALAGTIMSVEVVTKMILYYGHERVWSRFL